MRPPGVGSSTSTGGGGGRSQQGGQSGGYTRSGPPGPGHSRGPRSGGSGSTSVGGISFEDPTDFEEEEEELGYERGGDNEEFYQEEYGQELPWQEYIYGTVPEIVIGYAVSVLGEDADSYSTWVSGLMPDVLRSIEQNFYVPDSGPVDPRVLRTMQAWAVNYFKSRDGRLKDATRTWKPPKAGRGGGGGGGGGARGPTMADFDIDHLSEQTNQIWQSLVLADAPDARGVAKAYAQAIISNPLQKLDFQTFVEKRVKDTARFKSIWRSLPEGADPRQELARYYETARQFLPVEDAQSAAIGGAQLQSDPNAFRNRIGRSRTVRNSSDFISGIEGRMERLRGVLKG